MASGDTLCIFTPLHASYPASNYATPDLRNTPVLDFDGSTDEEVFLKACFGLITPVALLSSTVCRLDERNFWNQPLANRH
ncbi:MAG: hypothetical protein IPJ55_17665 [Chloracidobacterium sp.]|nr:hypothetical protein [Chloracidobacterium sp.]